MILQEILRVMTFVLNNFIKIWPLLLITIPLAVIIRRIKVTEQINKWLSDNIHISIFAATLFGAIAPFCSCSVIPVISSMLIAGVPLAPVMSFWLASPSMDPEIFFLSVASLGYPLAIARILATFLMSLAGGYITYFYLGAGNPAKYLRINTSKKVSGQCGCSSGVEETKLNPTSKPVTLSSSQPKLAPLNAASSVTLNTTNSTKIKTSSSACCDDTRVNTGGCCSTAAIDPRQLSISSSLQPASSNLLSKLSELISPDILKDITKSVSMIMRFLFIAYILEAIIIFYVPESLITSALGGSPGISILKATALSVPMYTTNLSALGILGGLMEKGLIGGAALAFLIGGATTTIPAMSAVYQLVHKKVFFVYLFTAIGFSLVSGLIFTLL